MMQKTRWTRSVDHLLELLHRKGTHSLGRRLVLNVLDLSLLFHLAEARVVVLGSLLLSRQFLLPGFAFFFQLPVKLEEYISRRFYRARSDCFLLVDLNII